LSSQLVGQLARLGVEEQLLRSYIDYMHSTVMDLYVAIQPNPLRYLVDRGKLAKPGLPLDPHNVTHLILYIARLRSLVGELLGIVGEAERYTLYRRVYEDVEGWELRGSIDWRLTLANIPSGRPPVQRVLVRTLSSPENLLLKAVIELVQDKLGKAVEALNGIVEVLSSLAQGLQWFLDGLNHLKGILEDCRARLEAAVRGSFLSLLPERLYYERSLEYVWRLVEEVERTPWKPGWVERLLGVARSFLLDYSLERSFDSLVDYIVGYLRGPQARARFFFKVYSWKLYEVYNLYLTLKALTSLGARIERLEERKLRARYDGEAITVYYNVSLLEERGLKAIPDITLSNERRIVVEAKFSRSPTYISKSIFKVLGYMALLNAHIGVLAYPSVKTRTPLDEEERTIYRSVLRKIERGELENPHKLTLRQEDSEKTVYIARLEPLKEREKLNEEIVRTIIAQSIAK